ncbi:MAG: efflux RND transporter periplasmic adaptor subunit, partial [Muribaculaceae bacterium]|nr:efflux RND transporter periplasmic adaptor subunit [Muribaculaceae bacterium]
NSQVKKGELIAELEKTLLESDLKSADANMESARLTYEYNKVNYERDKSLHAQQLISDFDYQTSLKDYEIARAAYDKAKADRVRAAKNLNYAEIYSPIDGVVISREVEVGQTVVSNMNVANLYTIADLDNMQVVGDVDEADIGQVKVGQSVMFTVDAYPDDNFEGTVTQVRLNPTTESNVVTYEVVVSTQNPDHKLIPGLTANLTIYVKRKYNVMVVPSKAFKFEPIVTEGKSNLPHPTSMPDNASIGSPKEKYLWVVRGSELIPVLVHTGMSAGTNIEIISGVNVGDVVAVDYDNTTSSRMAVGGPDGERSPFAPKPPSRNRK